METLFTGQNLIKLNSIDSTNNYAASLINATNVPEGTVIVAQEQTDGRGQRGSIWYSMAHENLMCTVIFKPTFLEINRQFYLSMSVALAVKEVLEKYLDQVYIKWPNDLLVGRAKIAGILIENSIRDSRVSHAIIGIGINVKQISFPEFIHATSMYLCGSENSTPESILKELCVYLEKWYLLLKRGEYQLIKTEYSRSLINFNKNSFFETAGTSFSGKIIDVREDGYLIIERESKEIGAYDIKSIKQQI